MLLLEKLNEKAREFVKNLDNKTKIEIGTLLLLLQKGVKLGEPQFKSMKAIHPKAHELRIKNRIGIYRIIYVLSIKEMILIPHAFMKKTQRTSQNEINLATKRLKEMINETK